MATRTIADRYELESKIGSGGMGTVWKAKDLVLDRVVAVKVLHEGLAEDAAFSERFRREARSAASLGHPNVVAVYDTGESDGTAFIVMEYVEGESLNRLLQDRGPLAIEDTARIGRSVLAGLGHAHSRGLVHRDVKPANVLFDKRTSDAKVVDFGIAKGLDETGGLTRTSGLIGTAAYLSPEQVSGNESTPQSDLYAVGCLMYACLAGEPPFTGSTPVAIAMRHLQEAVPPLRARRPDVPAGLEAVVMRALEKDAGRRFATAEEMDAAIAATGLDRRPASEPTVVAAPLPATAALQQHPVRGAPGTEVVQRPASSSNSRWLAALTAFLLVAAIAAVAVLYLQSKEAPIGEAQLPTLEPTPVPTPTPPPPTEAPTPPPTPQPTPQPPRTPTLEMPGGGLFGDDNDDEAPTPTPTEEFPD